MKYCPKCKTLTNAACPICGRSADKLREVEANDPVYLVNCRLLEQGMVTGLLENENIPFSCMGSMGAAASTFVGSMFELYNIYVPFSALKQAHELISEVFSENTELLARLENYENLL